MDDGIVMRRKVSLKQLVNGWIIVNHQHAGLAGAGQAQRHVCPDPRLDVQGQPAPLLVDEQLDHLPFFLCGGKCTGQAMQGNLDLILKLIGSKRNHASRVLGHQAQHFEQGLPHQRSIHQDRRQTSGQVCHQFHGALIHQRLEHRQRFFYQRLHWIGLSFQLPLAQLAFQLLHRPGGWQRGGTGGAAFGRVLFPEHGRERIQPFVQLALELTQADAHLVFDLCHAHPLHVAIAERKVTAPRVTRRTGRGA